MYAVKWQNGEKCMVTSPSTGMVQEKQTSKITVKPINYVHKKGMELERRFVLHFKHEQTLFSH